jgi:adenosylcobyric acid synthase
VEWIERQTAKPVFGVLPWFSGFKIDAEDSVELEALPPVSQKDSHRPAIGVIRLPHISNFTDFHPLAAIQDIQTLFIQKPEELRGFKAVIIPGSKNTRWDLDWLHTSGMARALLDFSDKGGHVLGICGGYQMLGQSVEDPSGLEGIPGTTKGIGLLPVTTRLAAPKTTTLSEFEYKSIRSEGYEIHMGSTTATGVIPMTFVNSRNGRTCRDPEGCVSENGKASGTYIHGFFDSPRVLAAWLDHIGISNIDIPNTEHIAQKQADYDRLKSHFTEHVDIPFLSRPAGKRLHSP